MNSVPLPVIEVSLDAKITSASVAQWWQRINSLLLDNPNAAIRVDAKDLTYIDTTGIAFLYDLQNRQRPTHAEIIIENLAPNLAALIPTSKQQTVVENEQKSESKSLITTIGKATQSQIAYVSNMYFFLKDCAMAMKETLLGKQKVRWAEVFTIATQAGANAVPIVLLIGFLMGVIMAFEIGLVAQKFGAVLFVADGIGISMFRELGPLMTAIIFAGRTGAAFAAEIGTQKVNEEINALNTFGISPISYLVLPRILASIMVLPLLTILADLVGIFGGALVLLKFNIGFLQFYNELLHSISSWDFIVGLMKATTFGITIAAIGCERGLTTGSGATSVGLSATSAVVTSIVWIVVIDGFFTVLTS